MRRLNAFLKIALQWSSIKSSLPVALFVGFILNFINQGGPLLALEFDQINTFKFGLTFLVPFLVSLYASSMAQLKFTPGEAIAIDADLECARCHEGEIHLHAGDKIPVCPRCLENTRWELKK